MTMNAAFDSLVWASMHRVVYWANVTGVVSGVRGLHQPVMFKPPVCKQMFRFVAQPAAMAGNA